MQSVIQSILARAAMWPERTAIFLHDTAVSYALLESGIKSAEVEIAKLSFDREAPIGVFIQSPVDHLIVCLALSKAGYTSASLRSDVLAKCHTYGMKEVIADQDIPNKEVKTHILTGGWYQNDYDADIARIYRPDQDRIVRIEFTSGSTGEPKPIGFTDGAVYHQTVNRIASYDLRGQISLCMFKVTVNVGFGYALACLMQGRTLCFSENVNQAIDMINYYRIDDMVGSPRQVLALTDALASAGRIVAIPGKIVLAGGQVSRADYTKIKLQLSGELHIDYGATETGPTAFANGNLLNPEGRSFAALAPFQTIEIQSSPVDGKPVAGPVRTRSAGMGAPYGGSLRQTEADRGDGWFYTGDVGVFTPRGCIELVGRSDDLVNVGGVKVSLDDIERVMNHQDGVADAAAIKSEMCATGEYLLDLVIVLKDAATDRAVLEQALNKELMGAHKLRYHYVVGIPKTDSGKVDRQALKGAIAG